MNRQLTTVFACVAIALAASSCGNVENNPDDGVGVDVLLPDTAGDDVSGQDVVVTPDAADVAIGEDAGDVVADIAGEDSADQDIEVVHPGCHLQLLPAIGNFGTVAVGFNATHSMRLVNTGTGACQITSAKIASCPADVNGEPVCSVDMDGQTSTFFEIVTEMSELGMPILGGAMREFQVRYTPSDDMTGVGPAGQVWALTMFGVKDVVSDVTSVFPACDGPCEPNLVGYAAAGQAKVLPADIDFGQTTTECAARARQVCVYNTGLLPVVLESISITDCGDEFEIADLQQLPQYIHIGSPLCFHLNYVPGGVGVDQCMMRITVNGAEEPVIDIPVRGAGVVEAAQVDEFIQQRSDTVDILFVIDDSGSMCDEQAVLLDSFETFIERARIWANEFQIGVITVDVEDESIAGRLNRGDKTVQPRYILPSVNILEDFADLAGIGCDGSSYIESGLHAALTALMPPLTTDTTVVCGNDADCTSNPVICPDSDNCDYGCVDGTCAGFNKGFLRDGARLEVIVMSDEDDQSVLPVADYVAMLKDLKAGLGEDMVHLNAIVGVEGVPLPGDEYSACTSSSGSTAMAGTRYIAAAEATGGVVGSICENSFEEAMLAISEKAFSDGGRLEYFLSRPADSSTIVVTIDPVEGGEPVQCVGGWEYNADANSVVLDSSGTCVPEPGNVVRVSYQVICVTD